MTLSEALAERGIRPEVETGTCGGDECPSYDGKRCRQTGCRERGCPPAWEVFASLLAARAPSPSEGLRERDEARRCNDENIREAIRAINGLAAERQRCAAAESALAAAGEREAELLRSAVVASAIVGALLDGCGMVTITPERLRRARLMECEHLPGGGARLKPSDETLGEYLARTAAAASPDATTAPGEGTPR